MSQKRRSVADEPFLIVRSSAANAGDSSRIASHAHDWHQLIYVRSGLARVGTAAGRWLAPPSWGIWVPAGIEHDIQFVVASALRTLYLRPDWRADLPENCMALAVSPLLRELILHTTSRAMLDRRIAREAAAAELIVGELGDAGPPPFALPEPTSPATLAAARLIVENDAISLSSVDIARTVGLGTRTLERRFQSETGMSLGRWRQQRMLLQGLERIATGASVKAAAGAAGYATASAFIAAFRKAFGATPARYFEVGDEQPRPRG